MTYISDYQKTPKGRFITQRANAKARGIPWQFTFEQWWKVWEDSGKWESRGPGPGQYCMCRKGDEGPYSPKNVEIKTYSENAKETWKVRKNRQPEPSFEQAIPRRSAWEYRYTCDWLKDSQQDLQSVKESTEST